MPIVAKQKQRDGLRDEASRSSNSTACSNRLDTKKEELDTATCLGPKRWSGDATIVAPTRNWCLSLSCGYLCALAPTAVRWKQWMWEQSYAPIVQRWQEDHRCSNPLDTKTKSRTPWPVLDFGATYGREAIHAKMRRSIGGYTAVGTSISQ